MNWNKVMPESDLPEGSRKVVTVGDLTILVARHDSHIHAVNNKCPHLGMPLQKGTITPQDTLICPWHKSEFDLHSGEAKTWSPWPPVIGKALGCLKKANPLTVYPTKIENGDIWVQCGA